VGNRAHLSLLSTALALTLVAPASLAQSQLLKASAGDAQLRTDSVQISHHARDLQVNFERRRRQMLPRFYPGTANHCLIVGRFCEWHPNQTDYVVPEEGKNIVRARAELLRDLEKASSQLPGDDWIMGQRVRYLTEGHDASAVSVSRSCRASKWWCDALLGLALHVGGDFSAADSSFFSRRRPVPAFVPGR